MKLKIFTLIFGLINILCFAQVMEHIVSGIEDLCGQWSHYYWKDK